MKHQHILDAIQSGERLNHGQKYNPFMTITDPAEAQAYLKALVAYHQAQVPTATPADAEYIERTNLTYFSGYHSAEVTHRVTGVLAQISLLDDLRSQLIAIRVENQELRQEVAILRAELALHRGRFTE